MTLVERNKARLEERGFTVSIFPDAREGSDFRVWCDQCQAMRINGLHTHETGCPNAMHECEECDGGLAHKGRRLCESCAMAASGEVYPEPEAE